MRRELSILFAAALFPAVVAQAQGGFPGRKVFSSDTIVVGQPTLSPDGSWLVFTRFISNQETELMIREVAGGEPRALVVSKGIHDSPRFTPTGDRLVFTSTLPRRSAAEDRFYLMSAPFDTRTGALSGSARQVSLDPVGQRSNPLISPDGTWVAYVTCCGSNTIRIVPVNGGNARTLVEPEAAVNLLAWSPDGRFVFYGTRGGPEELLRMRISRDGGTPIVDLRVREGRGPLSPDNKYSFVVNRPPGRATLRLFAADGRLLAEVPAPQLQQARTSFTSDGKYIIGAATDAKAPIKLVSVAGGPVRQLTPGDSYEWPVGWSEDGDTLHIAGQENGQEVLALVTRNGQVVKKLASPEANGVIGLKDGQLFYKTGSPGAMTGWRIMSMSLKDGSRKELARDITGRGAGCCDPVGPGGMYYGITGNEFYYRQVKGDRLEIHAMRVSGESRLVGELPADRPERSFVAVFQTRMAYTQGLKDSVRLRLVRGPGRQPTTLGTFPKSGAPGEMAWSHDGRQLTLYLGGAPQTQLVYRFDAAGMVQGPPLSFTLPFDYWYEVFWLPDGSGLTMIAQPKGAPVTEVALVKLADPEHPVLLTKADPVSKWGHILSPDGKYVAYPSEQLKGSSIYLIEVAELLKRAHAAP